MSRRHPSKRTYDRQQQFHYVPIDELLRQPAVRILYALRRHDWCDAADLRDVHLGLAPNSCGNRQSLERNAFSAAMMRLIRQGFVERREGRAQFAHTNGAYSYDVRITARGRAELSFRLRPDDAVEFAPARRGSEHLLCECDDVVARRPRRRAA